MATFRMMMMVVGAHMVSDVFVAGGIYLIMTIKRIIVVLVLACLQHQGILSFSRHLETFWVFFCPWLFKIQRQ